uniref:Biogenesis of lysosome-related organelles complex 1 subunit 2 n=1 Tax=Panagrellus redivivus TaxID=6233 RepID=A0A7E4W9I1_PANRE
MSNSRLCPPISSGHRLHSSRWPFNTADTAAIVTPLDNAVFGFFNEYTSIENRLNNDYCSMLNVLHVNTKRCHRRRMTIRPTKRPISDELLHEKERYKAISEELDSTFQELSGY